MLATDGREAVKLIAFVLHNAKLNRHGLRLHATPEQKRDRKVVGPAVQYHGRALEFADASMQADSEIASLACTQVRIVLPKLARTPASLVHVPHPLAYEYLIRSDAPSSTPTPPTSRPYPYLLHSLHFPSLSILTSLPALPYLPTPNPDLHRTAAPSSSSTPP